MRDCLERITDWTSGDIKDHDDTNGDADDGARLITSGWRETQMGRWVKERNLKEARREKNRKNMHNLI